MSTNLYRAMVLAGCLATSGAANASFIYANSAGNPDGSYSTLDVPGVNNFRSNLASVGVSSFNLGTSLAVTAPGTLQFSLWGKEAGYTNQFNYGGSQLFTTSGLTNSNWSNTASSGVLPVNSAGLLDFRFCVIAGGSGCVSNSGNQYTSFGSAQSIGINIVDSNTAWLLWDDSGAGPDDNHDDMIVKVRFTPVPEPATSLLFGVGLLAMGLTMRKRAMNSRVQ